MAQITITINSREYPIACEDGQELRIMQLAQILDSKAKQLSPDPNQVSESLLLAMVGLLLADELSEAKKDTPSSKPDSSAALKDLEQLDEEISSALQDMDNTIKTLAKQIESL